MICLFSVVTIAQAKVDADELVERSTQLPYFDEVIELESNGEVYPAMWQTYRTPAPQGTVVMLPDAGQHALWPHLQNKLRLKLPDIGWNTVTLTTPAAYDDALMQQLKELLASRGQFNVVVMGMGQGSDQALQFINEQVGVQGDFGWYLIMVNNNNRDIEQLRTYLNTLNMPVLDLWVPEAANSEWLAKHRLAALKRSQSDNITQIQSAWPATQFDLNMDHMARRVWGWVRTNAAGREANVTVNPRY